MLLTVRTVGVISHGWHRMRVTFFEGIVPKWERAIDSLAALNFLAWDTMIFSGSAYSLRQRRRRFIISVIVSSNVANPHILGIYTLN